MKKLVYPIIILSFFVCCGPRHEEVERITEDGVEVIVNHLEPYKIKGEPATLTLEEEFTIDTEDDEIANLGIPDILGFEVNSLGEIFILRTYTGEGDFIFKFDKNGEFMKSFGPHGQGPGEFQNPHHIALDSDDNIVIINLGRNSLLKYDKDGVFIRDYEMVRGEFRITPGPRENLLVLENAFDPENGEQILFLKLLSPDLDVIDEIDKFSFKMTPEKFRAIEPLFSWSASHNEIFVAKEERGYEIWVYDVNGTLIRKIRKEHKPIPVSEDNKKKILSQIPEDMRNMAYFPEFLLPYQSIVAGDDGKLLVSTYEAGNAPGEFMYDIFNEEGAFIGRKSLNIWIWEGHLWAKLRANKFYCLTEKDTGYKALFVYNMIWE
jgi:hypothetical protein